MFQCIVSLVPLLSDLIVHFKELPTSDQLNFSQLFPIMPCLDKETLNVLRVSLSMMILFTAVLSHEFIEEPLIVSLAEAGIGGIRKHDGYLSLCLVYLFNTLSCLIAPFLVTRITGKWSMCLGISTMLFFQVSCIP